MGVPPSPRGGNSFAFFKFQTLPTYFYIYIISHTYIYMDFISFLYLVLQVLRGMTISLSVCGNRWNRRTVVGTIKERITRCHTCTDIFQFRTCLLGDSPGLKGTESAKLSYKGRSALWPNLFVL